MDLVDLFKVDLRAHVFDNGCCRHCGVLAEESDEENFLFCCLDIRKLYSGIGTPKQVIDRKDRGSD